MELSERTKPYSEVCHNCHKEIIAYKNEEGDIKYTCPYCRAASISKRKNRRVVVITVTAPRGQTIIDR